ncbi:hypothetical protein TEA_028418 [Camellia sinensis var. sinensis]|uniref:LIM zinc-binding domain-containing protein n=1 Tax=Camellia sinensis var. sinensis TaxID=542762 RepID=A0A4S4EXK6_CAMSN|nr:hypothetical protein TEA_028418 [Camellia sinensis var. sinensis]
MATFAGTTQKCKACEKTVYLVDQLTADNKVYHKACFRCHHCKGTLKLSNYCSFEGVLYCKPHFNQLFKMTGSLDKSFEGAPKTVRVDRSAYQVLNGAKFSNPFLLDISDPVWGELNKPKGHTNNKVSSLFAGTQDKCVACKRTVYPLEKVREGVTQSPGCSWIEVDGVVHEFLVADSLHQMPAKKEKLPYDLLLLKSDCFGTLKERKKEREGSNGLVVGVKHDIPLVTKALKKENML